MTELARRDGTLGPAGSFLVHDQGAQLTTWSPGPVPVLFLSSASRFEPGAAIRGGIPVCFPWFGPGRSRPRRPAHGFARTLPWALLEHTTIDSGARLRYRLTEREAAQAPGVEHFPTPFEAILELTLGEDAHLLLTVRNTGEAAFDYEAALHTYLYVGDVAQVRVTGLDGSAWLDKVGGGQHLQRGELVLTGETDRVYASTAAVQVHDPVLERTVHVAKSGSASTIVWNPGPDTGEQIDDLGTGEWAQLICVEAGNVLDDSVSLAPGEEHSMGTDISVKEWAP